MKLRWNPDKIESRVEKVRSLEIPHKIDVANIFQVITALKNCIPSTFNCKKYLGITV